jgi:TetR/AcrR family transcriptional regulator of autoinduction and epiphytic fitness
MTSLDPRIERSRRLICDAALEEMGEVGYGAMTIESIARRAGVGKATVYRHWNGKLDLIESALDSVSTDMMIPQDGSTRERIAAVLGWLAAYLSDVEARGSSCMPALVSAAQYDSAVRDFHHRFSATRRQVLIDLINVGKESGDFTTTADSQLLAEMLVGPLFYGRMMSGELFPPERVGEIIDVVLS